MNKKKNASIKKKYQKKKLSAEFQNSLFMNSKCNEYIFCFCSCCCYFVLPPPVYDKFITRNHKCNSTEFIKRKFKSMNVNQSTTWRDIEWSEWVRSTKNNQSRELLKSLWNHITIVHPPRNPDKLKYPLKRCT